MYKQIKNIQGNINCVLLLETNSTIPFDPANTDYQNFKKEVLAGAELQDADGKQS